MNHPSRVAIVSQSLRTGGAEWQAVLCAATLKKAGVSATLVTYHPKNDYHAFLLEHGIEPVCVWRTGERIGRRVWRLSRLLARRRIEVVHAFSASASITSLVAGRLGGVSCIFCGYRAALPPGPATVLAHRVLSRFSTGWIANSNTAKQAIVDYFSVPAARVYVVHNGILAERLRSPITVEQAREELGLPPDRPVVTIVANLRPEKNHTMFLRMAARVLVSRPDTTFAIAGDGSERTRLEQLSRRLDASASVSFLGHRSDMARVLKATDVVCLTSTSEGLPNVLLEAGAVGVPSVSSANGGANEIIEEGRTGFLVPCNDVTAMANRVLQLLGDDDLRARMAAASVASATARFSADAMASDLVEVYRRGCGCG